MRKVHTTIKMTLVGILASLIGYSLNVQNYLTAGVIGVLSIHLTKKDSLRGAKNRILDGLFAIVLAVLFFELLGYTLWVYAVILFLFIYTSFLLNIQEGIVPSIVLITHFLIKESATQRFILEEVLVLVIAIGVALIFNVFYPQTSVKQVERELTKIDQMLRDHLYIFALLIKEELVEHVYIEHYQLMKKRLLETLENVEMMDKDLLIQNDHRYLEYLYMRREQISTVNQMYEHMLVVTANHPYSLPIGSYILELVSDIGHQDLATNQLLKLNELYGYYRQTSLPDSRKEFEMRAMLYQILGDLERFLKIKIAFHKKFPDFMLKHK